ncbi:hypothetical protein [Tabrizicola thermarum]|uniref:hypothetical protein n=1 Tax=Tabrizicola thermarum TaxID=2670345 RepID=UPI000FFB4B49|nr:hypothetical protein [Tabrizicola thermarum]
MTRFVVDLGDLDLPEDTRMSIAQDLQKTALAHIARIKFKDPFAIKFPKDWWGLIVRPDIGNLLEAEGVLQKNIFSARGTR